MKNINQNIILICLLVFSILSKQNFAQSQDNKTNHSYQLENPISVEFLKKNLAKKSPRLVLNKKIEKNLKQKLKTDPLIQSIYQSIKYNAELVVEKSLITVDVPDNPNSQQNQL